jgi:hypothetical protein
MRRPLRRCLLAGVLLLALLAGGAAAAAPAAKSGHPRTITLINRTHETIWAAATPGALSGATGWRLAPGSSVSFRVSDHYNARIWGRTGCRFGAGGRGRCQTGDCGGRFQCTGWGQIPATLAEFDMDSYDHLDFYDVSMVDGSNLPMYINTVGGRTPDKISSRGCEQGHGCTTTVRCPNALRVHASGKVVACISPCARFGTDRYCCRGKFAKGCSPARTWPVDYALVFKRAEPYAYSWSGDDSTSVFTCAGGCSYRIVFGVTPPAVGGPPG